MPAAAIALNRYGLGARPDEAVPADPRRWLLAQLDRFEPRPAAFANVPTRRAVAGELAAYFEELRGLRMEMGGPARRRAAPVAAPSAMQPAATGAAMAEGDETAGLPQQLRRYIRQEARGAYLAMVEARTNAALITPAPFAERLVHFWANHFAISIDKLPVIALGGLLEFEAIRPHVLGTFRDMLVAVEQHPAMLLYLDQAQSIGPGSALVQRLAGRPAMQRAGLNENLAREILELHTLGVGGGYAQADVTELARALTGWTVAGLGRGRGARFIGMQSEPGEHAFVPAIHEPGPRRILGRAYPQAGADQGLAVLADLASHPATARHLATKLARHFAGDTPPPALVERLAAAYVASGGDLPTLYRVLIDARETWVETPVKFRSPWEWSLAAMRAVGTRQVQAQAAAGLMNQLGQPVWRPGSPAGWDDLAASWAGPDALVRRVEAAERIAGRAGALVDARQLAARVLPGALSAATQQAIARAESPAQGLALMLVAPEFLRR